MPDPFVPFEIAFAPASPGEEADAPRAAVDVIESATGGDSDAEDARSARSALAAVRRFRAALADALDAQLDEIVREVVCELLGRELQIAHADVTAIARGALARYAADLPLRVRAHPHDVPALETLELPIVTDAALRRGDLTIELRSGTIDASLGARLEALLARG